MAVEEAKIDMQVGGDDNLDQERLSMIMKVDHGALLNTIKEIEVSMRQYNRQDVVPKWAQGFIARIELLEKQSQFSSTGKGNGGGTAGMAPLKGGGDDLASLAAQDSMIEKLKSEIQNHMGSSKLSLESKLSTITMELDRMHKLLQIRPTTTELQQVVVSINEMDTKLKEGVHNIAKNVRSQVYDTVAQESSGIVANVQSSIDLNADSIGLIAKKVDNFGSDITTIRKMTEGAIENMNHMIKQCQYDVQNAKEICLQLESVHESDAAKLEQSLQNLRFGQDMANEKVEEFRESIKVQMGDLKDTLTKQDAIVKEQVAGTAASLQEMQAKVETTKKSIDDFRFTYEVDAKTQQEENQSLANSVKEISENFQEVSEYVTTLKDFDVLKGIELQAEQISTLKATVDDNDSTIQSVVSKVTKVSKAMAQCEEQMEKLPAMVNDALSKLEKLNSEKDQLATRVGGQEQEILEIKTKFDDIDELQNDIASLKASNKDIDGRLKQAQTTSMSLLEVTGDHDKRLEEMTELIDNSDAIVEQKMLKMQGSIMDNVAAKQAEIEALVANIHENLEVMSLGLDGGASQESKGGKSVGGASRPGSKPRPGVPVAVAGSVTPIGGASQEGSLSNDEKLDVLNGSAEFIGDLCINFEEIAVRKSYVGDIPSAMCERITSTAQAMAGFIANITDSEAIQVVLRGSANEVEYDDTLVADLRSKKVEEFIDHITGIVNSNNGQPGAVRNDARNLFVKKIRTALSLCMSKHDQVLVVGNSRFGRIKIPTCIACDRPLLEKVRHDSVQKPDNGPRRNFPVMGGGGITGQESLDDSAASSSLIGGVLSGSPVPRNKQRGQMKGSVRLPQTQSDKLLRPNSSNAGPEAEILRSALAIPGRPGNSTSKNGFGQSDERLPDLY